MPTEATPPLTKTLPSMRVVAPIRLSIRFCGLLDLPNMVFASLPQRDGVGRLRLRRAGLVDPHLHVLDLRLRAHPERPFHPLEVLESQPERGRPPARPLPGLQKKRLTSPNPHNSDTRLFFFKASAPHESPPSSPPRPSPDLPPNPPSPPWKLLKPQPNRGPPGARLL